MTGGGTRWQHVAAGGSRGWQHAWQVVHARWGRGGSMHDKSATLTCAACTRAACFSPATRSASCDAMAAACVSRDTSTSVVPLRNPLIRLK
jgi:hypothetical protein